MIDEKPVLAWPPRATPPRQTSVICQTCGIDYHMKHSKTCFMCAQRRRVLVDVMTEGQGCPRCGKAVPDAPPAPFRAACDNRGDRHHVVTLSP